MNERARQILRQKIERLQEARAITADESKKFQLDKEIEQAQAELAGRGRSGRWRPLSRAGVSAGGRGGRGVRAHPSVTGHSSCCGFPTRSTASTSSVLCPPDWPGSGLRTLIDIRAAPLSASSA